MANDQSDHITQSITSVARRTQRALSPWAQRSLQADAPARSIARWPMTLAAASTTSLSNRIQHAAEHSTARRFERVTNGAASLEHFAENIVDHFPPVAAKYEPRPMASMPAVQRKELPLSDEGFAVPDFNPPAGPEIAVAPDTFYRSPAEAPPPGSDVDRSALPSISATLRQARAQRKPDAAASASASQPASTAVRSTDQPAKVRRAQVTEVTPRQEAAGISKRPTEPVTRTDQPSSSDIESPLDQSARPSPRRLARTIGQLRPFIQRQVDETTSSSEEQRPSAEIKPSAEPLSQTERIRRFTQTVQREAQAFTAPSTQPETPSTPQPVRSSEPPSRVVRRKIEEIAPTSEPSSPLRSGPVERPEAPSPIETTEPTPVIPRAVDATSTPRVTDQPATIEPAVPETIQRTSEPAVEAAPFAPIPAPIRNLSTDMPLRRAAATEQHEEAVGSSELAISRASAATVQRTPEPASSDARPYPTFDSSAGGPPGAVRADDALEKPALQQAKPTVQRAAEPTDSEQHAAETEATTQPQPVRSSTAGAPRAAAAAEAAAQPEMPSQSTPMVQRTIEPAGAVHADDGRSAGAAEAISPLPQIIPREEALASIDEVMPLRLPSVSETVQRNEDSLSSDQSTERPAFDLGRRVLARTMPRTQLPVSQTPPASSAPVVQHHVDQSESLRSDQVAPQSTTVAGTGPEALPSARVESTGTAEGSQPTASRPSITQLLRRKIAEAAAGKASSSTSEVEPARTEPITSTPGAPPAPVQAKFDTTAVSEVESPLLQRADVSTPVLPITRQRALTAMPLVSRTLRMPAGAEERAGADKHPGAQSKPAPARTPLPLPPIKSSLSQQIQRAPEPISISHAPQQVQRAEGESSPSTASQPPAAPAIDLDDLARQVYPHLKRLIAVEHERIG